MEYIIFLLAIAVIFLAARLFLLRRAVNKITNGLGKLNAGTTQEPLRVAMSSASFENLCLKINDSLEIKESLLIEAKNREEELRGQITNISHDLRTPLTAILGYVGMIKAAPEKGADYLGIIESRAQALQRLVEQFYELSIIDDPANRLEPEPADINSLLTNCLLGHYALFDAKGIAPQVSVPERPVYGLCDAKAMERVFQNLIQNALKFAEEEITVTLREDETRLHITFANDAKGLTAEDAERLPERFYTGDKSRSSGSTGLGLYIVKRLLEKMGGGIAGIKTEGGQFCLEMFVNKKTE